ncbi:MAG TPA: hypothetical protein VGA99_03035 [bacterium]
MKRIHLIVLALLVFVSYAHAQKATEIFIPIGKSPGLSGKSTSIGKIGSFDLQQKTLTVSDSTASYTVKITDETQIWLDRSSMKQSNKKGTLADLAAGARVEIKYVNNERKEGAMAEWIKVEVKSNP